MKDNSQNTNLEFKRRILPLPFFLFGATCFSPSCSRSSRSQIVVKLRFLFTLSPFLRHCTFAILIVEIIMILRQWVGWLHEGCNTYAHAVTHWRTHAHTCLFLLGRGLTRPKVNLPIGMGRVSGRRSLKLKQVISETSQIRRAAAKQAKK